MRAAACSDCMQLHAPTKHSVRLLCPSSERAAHACVATRTMECAFRVQGGRIQTIQTDYVERGWLGIKPTEQAAQQIKGVRGQLLQTGQRSASEAAGRA